MADFKIAAQLYTLRDYTQTVDELEKTLRKVKKIGYNAIQVSGFGHIDPLIVKELSEKNDLEICVTHTPEARLKNDLDSVIEQHKMWNCKYVGLGAMPGDYRKSYEDVLRFTKDFSKIAQGLKSEGLKFVYHNHSFEFEKFNGKTMMDIIFENTDPEIFEFELDTYWIQAGGANPVDWIKKVDGRMGVVHFKDMLIKDNVQHFAEIGMGNLNWESIINACRETGVLWAAIEQDTCFGDPFESLEISFKNTMKFINGGSK